MDKFKFDKTVYKEKSYAEADNTVAYWRTKTMAERLSAAYMLSLRAYGYDPNNPPKMDKTYYKERKHSDQSKS